jgi:DNA-binding transcriptional regulator YiaG
MGKTTTTKKTARAKPRQTVRVKRRQWQAALDRQPATTILSSAEYRDALDRLGLNQPQAARLLGQNGRTARRWALGEQPVSPLASKVLRYMLANSVKPEDFDPEWQR